MAKNDSGFLGISRLDNQGDSAGSGQASPAPGFTAPVTPMEVKLAGIWQAALPGIPIHRESNFIAIGGDSLSLAQVITELESTFALKLTVEEVANNLSLQDMAAMLERVTNRNKA
jgi:acyl carrier protein